MREMLRDAAPTTRGWHEDVHSLRQKVSAASPGSDAHLLALGHLGDQLRCAPSFQAEAVTILEQAVSLATTLNLPKALAANQIRLATALQYVSRHDKAIAMFHEAIATIDAHRIRGLKDFAWQHLGKCLAETGAYPDARQCFRRALQLRRRRGNKSLIASTEQAFAVLAAWEFGG